MIGATGRAEPSSPPRADRGRGASGSGVRCGFCHGAFARRDGPRSCRGCGGLLHEGCWYEAGRCPSLGCAGPDARREQRRRPPLRSPRSSSGRWSPIGAGLHLVTLGAWLAIGLAALLLGGGWVVLGGALVGCWLLLVGVRRDWRLDAPWLLVASGLAAGVGGFPILVTALQVLDRIL